MKFYKLNIIFVFVAAVLATTFFGCVDELPLPDTAIGEGEARVTATVSFNPLVSALDRKSRATAGNALKNINTLTVVVYDKQKRLYKIFYNAQLNPKVDIDGNEDMPQDSAKYEHDRAEETTAKATVTFPEALPFGKYYIYAIANVDEKYINTFSVSDPEKLKKISYQWNSDNITANGQMFGYFTNKDDEQSYGFDAPVSIVNNTHTELHAWVKRLASKVTVVYDGSGLHQGVTVYIHKVTIKDIPEYCTLGEFNSPHNTDSLIADGESIYYAYNENVDGMVDSDLYPDVSQFEHWMPIRKAYKPKGAFTIGADNDTVYHSEAAHALYFYENMQGNYEGQAAYDKRQFADSVGSNINKPGQPGYKDNIRYGTYIEVEGFYDSNNPLNISSGKIKYRFMLGKNTTFNYNAERNYHYKLTLKFKGWANQPDWHIDYEQEDPSVNVPKQYYVSYLYNHKSMFPVRLIGDVTDFKVEIVENNWAPYDSTQVDSVPPALVGNASDYLSFKWNKWAYVCTENGWNKDEDKNGGYFNGVRSPWLGFLSLTVPYDSETAQLPTNLFDDPINNFYSSFSQNYLKQYYEASGDKGWGTFKNDIPQNKRTFIENGVITASHNSGNNAFEITEAPDKSKTVKFPLWTRPKTMIYISGFTGNNPYDTYQRKAKLKVTAKFHREAKGDTTITKYVPIYQVRRVVNPKAVWRKWDAKDRFHVVLMRREDPKPETKYKAFESDGEWRASISVGNSEFIELQPGQGARSEGRYIYGNTGSNIDFYIKFNGVGSADNTACALVEVEYHGFTCKHTIFVRQGYNRALAIDDTGTKWSSFSLYSCGNGEKNAAGRYNAVVTANPIALGTFFKRGNLKRGVLIDNNNTYSPLKPIGEGSFDLSNGESLPWDSIKGDISADFSGWGRLEATVNGVKREYRLPTYDEFKALMQHDFGFGIMYGDGADETQSDPSIAHGFQDAGNETKESEKGMRGVIIYNKSNANQIFFPVGKNGIGRRTIAALPDDKNYPGYLRYGGVWWLLDVTRFNEYAVEANGGVAAPEGKPTVANRLRPIPYNMPASPGAIYWIDKMVGKAPAWDMNYFDMNVNQYDEAVLGSGHGGGDALPIKMIYVGDIKE